MILDLQFLPLLPPVTYFSMPRFISCLTLSFENHQDILDDTSMLIHFKELLVHNIFPFTLKFGEKFGARETERKKLLELAKTLELNVIGVR